MSSVGVETSRLLAIQQLPHGGYRSSGSKHDGNVDSLLLDSVYLCLVHSRVLPRGLLQVEVGAADVSPRDLGAESGLA